MQITQFHEKSFPVSSNIRNAVMDFSEMTVSVVGVVTDVRRNGRPVVGYGISLGRYAQESSLRERFLPRLERAGAEALSDDEGLVDPFRANAIMMRNEKPGGHGERSAAVGAVDMALWDALAKVQEVPLWKLLADRFNGGQADSEVSVYAGGGYYTDGDLDAFRDEIRLYRDLGYSSVKMKIGGAELDEDLRRIDVALEVLESSSHLAVDANGRFGLVDALRYARALAPYGLKWAEELCDPLDYRALSVLADEYDPPLAMGENTFSFEDTRNLLRYGGLRADRDFIQVNCALSYGLVEYLRILDLLDQMGWDRRRAFPHGGHQMALNVAAGLQLSGNESYPGIHQPFGGYADEIPVLDGRVRLPDTPGVGHETKNTLYAKLKQMGLE